MAAPMDSPDELEAEDYYAVLNIDREASSSDITNAFRRLSKIYHPDKHSDHVNKKHAEKMFNKLKEIHTVLSDPHQRAVYDTLGVKGLETYGKELVLRTRSPQEIREEYERLVKEHEERKMQQSISPSGRTTVTIDATDVFERYSIYESEGLPNVEMKIMSIEQTVEIPVSQNNSLFWTGNLIVQNGRGAGVLVASLRRIMSVNSWLECQMSAGNRNAMSLTGFRRLTKHSHIRMSGSCQIEPHHIAFAEFNTMLASQFDRNLTGQLEFKMQGGRSSMCSALRWDNQTHHLECALQVGVPNCFVKLAYVRRFVEKEAKTTIAGKLGTMGFVVEYGMEKKISQYSILGGYVSIGVPVGVLVKIKLQRGNQTYVCPVHLAEEIIPEAIFYGTAVPIAAYFIIRNLIIRPFLDQKKEEEVNKKKEKFAEEIAERRREAQAAKELMQATVRRSREEEELKGGLIIVKAWYGKLATTHTGELNESQCIEVKDPLQALVRLSKLVLPDSKTKSNIPGFYDPCIGEDKSLYIRYKFQRVLHETTVGDLEPIKIPKQKHLIRSGSDENS